MSAELALLALLLAAYALVAARLERLSIGPAMAFVAIGLIVSEDLLGPVSLEPGPVAGVAQCVAGATMAEEACAQAEVSAIHTVAPLYGAPHEQLISPH